MQALEVYSFFLAFSKQEREDFFSHLRPVSLPKDTIIHYQNDVCKDVLLLTSGEIRLYIQGDDFSQEVTLYTLKVGEQCLANTASVLSQSKTIGTAITQTPIEGYLLSEVAIKAFMQKSFIYQQYIMSLYSKKLYEVTLALHRAKFQQLDERIMGYLMREKRETVSITHARLAEEMKTSRTVVSRVLKKLEHEGKLKLFRGYIALS